MSISPHNSTLSGIEWTQMWRAGAVAERPLDVTVRLIGAVLVGAAAAALAILLGGDAGMDLHPTTLQIVAAVGVAALTLLVVPLAIHTTQTEAHVVIATAALLSAGAAAIHFAVIAPHLEEWWAFGAFFIASASAQLLWSLLLLSWPSRPLFWAGVLGNAAIVALWVVTRVEGTLVGPEPHEPEPVGVADGIATGFETAIVALGLMLVFVGVPQRHVLSRVTWLVGAFTLALTSGALLSAMGAAPGIVPSLE